MKKILCFLLLAIVSQQSYSQWTASTNLNTLVSDDSQYDETIPVCAPSVNGSTFISWFQANGNGSYDAMLQLLDVNGFALWSGPLVVSNQPQSSALYLHDFTTDHSGNALFAFQDIRNGNTETVIYKIDTAGNFIWGNNGIQLHDANATFEVAPRIAVFDNDEVVVSWSASASGNKWVAWQILSASGTPLFTNPQIIDSPTENFSRAVPVVCPGNTFILVYVQETGNFPGLTSLIFCQKYLQNGTADWASPVQVSSYGLGFVAQPIAAAENLGGCYIGFNSGTPGAPAVNDAFLQHISATGILDLGNDGVELSALNGNHKFLKDMFYNHNDNKVYCVLKVTDSGQNGAGVYAQAFDGSTMVYTNNGLEISPISTGNPCEAFTIDDAGNGCVVSYSEGGFNNQSIKAHKFDYAGNIIFPNPSTLSDAASGKSRITSNQMNNGQLILSWEDSRINAGVYAQNMNADGTLGIITGMQPGHNHNFEVFPSITSGEVSIHSKKPDLYFLYSADGRLIQTFSLTGENNRYNFSGLSNGLYLIKSQSGETAKVIKATY